MGELAGIARAVQQAAYSSSHRALPSPCTRRPCILIGSAFGALFALVLQGLLPPGLDCQPGVYAVVGATAMLGATFRSSISLVVIVVEGTNAIGARLGQQALSWAYAKYGRTLISLLSRVLPCPCRRGTAVVPQS